MSDRFFMLTLILILLPLFASIFVAFLDKEAAKKLALVFSTLTFLVAAYILFLFEKTDAIQFVNDYPWIKSLGIRFTVGIDGISLPLVLLTTLLTPLIIYSTFSSKNSYVSIFYSLVLFMEMALIGVFTSFDGFLFYIFWELALIPIYFICLLWGGEGRVKITFKFFIYTLLGSLFMLFAFIYIYLKTSPTTSFSVFSMYEATKNLSANEQGFLFCCIFIAFAIKIPIFPFHTWQPDTYTNAPTPGTMLLSGIMLKMGLYGLIRWLLPLLPLGIKEWGNTAVVISIIGIVYASCIAIVQKDFKRLIAYSSIAHVGLISAGIFSSNLEGLQGAMIQMFSHGINVVGLFLITDIIFNRTNTLELEKIGGIRSINPAFAVMFLIILLGSIALPLSNGFVGEFLLLNGIYKYNSWMATFAGLTVILGAVYMLRSYQAIMLGEAKQTTANFATLAKNESIILIIICILVIALGVYPNFMLELSEPSILKIINASWHWTKG